MKKEKRMRCLVDRFFWCPFYYEDNYEGQLCHLCPIDVQLERVNLERKRKVLKPIRLPEVSDNNE